MTTSNAKNTVAAPNSKKWRLVLLWAVLVCFALVGSYHRMTGAMDATARTLQQATTTTTTTTTGALLRKNNKDNHNDASITISTAHNADDDNERPTFHVLFGLYGDSITFFHEWEATLRSVLLNAPLETDLMIHCVVNADASRMVRNFVINEWNLTTNSIWRNRIQIVTYQVEAYEDVWFDFIKKKIRGANMDRRVTLGGYYRLMANEILVRYGNIADRDMLVYMDNDLVVIRNLQELIPHLNATTLFQMGSDHMAFSPCSGFIAMNAAKMATQFWTLVDNIENIGRDGGDQSLLRMVKNRYPHLVGTLPKEWDIHILHGWHEIPQTLAQAEGGAGFLHFSGQRPHKFTFWGARPKEYTNKSISLNDYCNRVTGCRDAPPEQQELVARTWGLADYYIRISWTWAKLQGKSLVRLGHEGYPLEFREIIVPLVLEQGYNNNNNNNSTAEE